MENTNAILSNFMGATYTRGRFPASLWVMGRCGGDVFGRVTLLDTPRLHSPQ